MLNDTQSKQRKILKRIHARQAKLLRDQQKQNRGEHLDEDLEDDNLIGEREAILKTEIEKNEQWLRPLGFFARGKK